MMKRKKKNKQELNPFYDPALKARHASASRFKNFTLTSLIFSVAFLAFFLFDIVGKGLPAFSAAYVKVDVIYNEKSLDDSRNAVERKYRDIVSRAWLRDIPNQVRAHPELMNTTENTWVLADDQVDQYLKNHNNKLKSKNIALVDELYAEGLIEKKIQYSFLYKW